MVVVRVDKVGGMTSHPDRPYSYHSSADIIGHSEELYRALRLDLRHYGSILAECAIVGSEEKERRGHQKPRESFADRLR